MLLPKELYSILDTLMLVEDLDVGYERTKKPIRFTPRLRR